MLPVPRLVPEFDQAYVGVRVPSSASDAVAEQVRELPTTTLELGEMLVLLMVGAVFAAAVLADVLTEDPEEVCLPSRCR